MTATACWWATRRRRQRFPSRIARPAGPHPVATASAARTPPRSGPGASRPHASHAYSTPRARPAASMTRVLASTPSPRPTPARPKITWSRGVNESTPIKVPTASTPPRVATVRARRPSRRRAGRVVTAHDRPRPRDRARSSSLPTRVPTRWSAARVREGQTQPGGGDAGATRPPPALIPLLSSSAAARSRSPSLISSRPRPLAGRSPEARDRRASGERSIDEWPSKGSASERGSRRRRSASGSRERRSSLSVR